MSWARKWTPSAALANATSVRELMGGGMRGREPPRYGTSAPRMRTAMVRQGFQIAGQQSFSQPNVVDAGVCRFGDLLEQALAFAKSSPGNCRRSVM